MELRPYQSEAVTAVENEWASGKRNTILNLPTGCGKTIVFATIGGNQVRKGERVLVLAHREELLNQAADKIKKATGIDSAIEKAERHAAGSMFPVTVASMQTLVSEKRRQEYEPDYFSTCIIDECHHAASDSYKKILDYFDFQKVLGVTATPFRSDKRKLANVFDSIAYEYPLARAIKEGYLVPIKAQMIPIEIDLSNVKVTAGDFQSNDLDDALMPYLEQIATEMEKYCRDRKTVVFTPLIATSRKFVEILRQHGFRASEVNGGSADRAEILADFEAGKIDVLCNSMLLTEGWDCPPVDCIVPLRATKSRGLYMQMIGRGTRPSPETGKKDLLILDFLWMTAKHDLCRPSSLVARSERIAEKIDELEAGTMLMSDLMELEQLAMEDVLKEDEDAQKKREEALAEQLGKQKSKKRKLINPLEYAVSFDMTDLIDYEPSFKWEREQATEKQLRAIENFGLDASTVTCKGMASVILDRLFERSKAGYASPKQVYKLEQYGYEEAGLWNKDEAKFMLDVIAQSGWNRWKIPLEFRPGMPRSTPRRLRQAEASVLRW